jgi:uncharacterized membrane protein YraQ (UPF0718 family)
VFVSIVLQSLPFVLVGVFASALVQQMLRGELVARYLPRRPALAVLLSSLFGLIAPVCDCGAIPLGRQLMAKGVPIYAAIAFLIAAPVINPITLFSTALAFQGNVGVVVLRAAMTLSVALIAGLLAARLLGAIPLGVPTLTHLRDADKVDQSLRTRARLSRIVQHATSEYFEILFFVVLGALFTAASQTLVPRADLTALGSQRAGSVLVLMPIATILSICSEADAFVARAFAGTFSFGAVLAFMTIGQIVDLRNGLLMWRTLGGRVLLLIVLIAYPLVFVEGVLLNRLV